jgi:hypothetical protein
VKYLPLLLSALVACSRHPVIVWGGASTGENIEIVIDSGGRGSYKTSSAGVEDLDEALAFTKGQVRELEEEFRSHHVCELVHDPSYTPAENEGQTTLELMFDDLTCKVTLYDLEWQRGNARDIAQTMRSMRPLRTQKRKNRTLDPRGAAS